ncbi:hypothetical protein ACGLWP_004689 [Salmonella enterica subsp. enterica serovar Enteritidis]
MRINLPDLRILTGVLFLLLISSVLAGIQVSPMNINLNNLDEYSGTICIFSTSIET